MREIRYVIIIAKRLPNGMYSDRKALTFSAIPFALVSLATLALFFVADQTLDALRVSMRFSDLWMEADRGACLQLLRCLDHGGSECDLVEQRLQRPLAYVRATQERAKAHPDNHVISQELEKAGITASLLRFRLRWFESVARLAGLASRNPEETQNQESRLKGQIPADLRAILELDQRAKSPGPNHSRMPPPLRPSGSKSKRSVRVLKNRRGNSMPDP